MDKVDISEDSGKTWQTVGYTTSADVSWDKFDTEKDSYEYYMNRKGRYYFRGVYGRLSFDAHDDEAKEIKKLKYGTRLTIKHS
jgi:hypothetical protein